MNRKYLIIQCSVEPFIDIIDKLFNYKEGLTNDFPFLLKDKDIFSAKIDEIFEDCSIFKKLGQYIINETKRFNTETYNDVKVGFKSIGSDTNLDKSYINYLKCYDELGFGIKRAENKFEPRIYQNKEGNFVISIIFAENSNDLNDILNSFGIAIWANWIEIMKLVKSVLGSENMIKKVDLLIKMLYNKEERY